MPNHCKNMVSIYHQDANKLQEFIAHSKDLFQFILPCPKELAETEEGSSTPLDVYVRNIEKCGYISGMLIITWLKITYLNCVS